MRTLNESKGYYFFSKPTMKFFNSKIESQGYVKGDKAYFITSERFQVSSQYPKKYSIREIDLKSGNVETLGEFQAYNTKSNAYKEIKNILGD